VTARDELDVVVLTEWLREYGELVMRGRPHDARRQAEWLVGRGVIVELTAGRIWDWLLRRP
jgi:hypothetical protein